jgi:hypothetical protein
MLHQQYGAIFSRGREEHVGVDGATELVGKLFEGVEIALVVLLSVKTDGAAIATLDDVPR